MCGIAGFITAGNYSLPGEMEQLLATMSNAIKHRGPDDRGSWSDAEAGVWLGHRRLSILDLSSAGHQPMQSASGRYVIAFNGEIYNHLSLRKELEHEIGIKWNGTSDTETLVQAISCWGLQYTLLKLRGMFSFAVWDKKLKTLSLARDPIGEKHLYYGWQGNTFVFGSELKALKKHPDFQKKICRNSLSLFLLHNYVPAPYSIFQGINKLLPGHFISINTNNDRSKQDPIEYWSLLNIPQNDKTQFLDEKAVINELENKLIHSVKSQMLSDVPIGSLLSGGIDSTLITAIMQKISEKPVKTFTIGFEDKNFNEADHASSIAEYLQTNHHELYVTSQDSLSIVPDLASYWDEPFADSSQIPTYLVMQLASKEIKVALSGDGADELFGGYGRIFRSAYDHERMSQDFLKNDILKGNLLKKYKTLEPSSELDHFLRQYSYISGDEKLSLFNPIILQSLNGDLSNKNFFEPMWQSLEGLNLTEKIMWIFQKVHLEGLLGRLDSSTMSASVEGRVPFVDHRLIEYVFGHKLNFDNHLGKKHFKDDLLKDFNHEFVNREKQGFSFQVESWVYQNIELVRELINNGKVINQIDKKIIDKLSLVKSRTNGGRIWKLFFLERFLSSL